MLEFNEEKHEYTLNGKKLISVTQLMQKHGLAPVYAGVSTDVLRNKAERGTLIHKEIEDYIKHNQIGFTNELIAFIEYVKEHQIDIEHSELKVYNDIVAGTIDLVIFWKNQLYIADLKTTYTLHKKSVSWQISIYDYLYWYVIDLGNKELMKKDYKSAKGQAFHFNKNGELNVVDIPLKPFEEIERLMECERFGKMYQIESNEKLDASAEELISLLNQKAKLEEQIDLIKQAMFEDVKASNGFSNEFITISYIPSSKKDTFDSNKFKKENPDIYQRYLKSSETKETLRITLKGEK